MSDIVDTTGAPTNGQDPLPGTTTASPPEVEASGAETVTMHFADIPLEMPDSVDDWELDTVEAFEDNHVVKAMRGFLGDDGLPVKGLAGLLTLLHDGGYDDREIIAWLQRLSEPFGTRIDNEDGVGVIRLAGREGR